MSDNMSETEVSIGTLNVGAASKDRATRILNEWIIPANLDVYVLTETNDGPGSHFIQEMFATAGWGTYQRPLASDGRGVLIASRLSAEYCRIAVDGMEEGRSVVVDVNCLPRLRVVGMYVPNRGKDPAKMQRKKDFLNSWGTILSRLPRDEVSTLLVGDLNIVPRTQAPHFLPQLEFEYRWYDQLSSSAGLYDAALVHGPKCHESTWVAHTGEGYTFDHIMPARALQRRIVSFEYDHTTRSRPLVSLDNDDLTESLPSITDHSAIVVRLRLDEITRRVTHRLGTPAQGSLF